MTAFITHCWKNKRVDLAALLACACLVCCLPDTASAQAAPAEVSQFNLDRTPEGIFMSAIVRFELPQPVEDALLKGIPMFFVAEADVLRVRWYWIDKKVLTAERHMRLAFQPLTRRWRLNVASGPITNNSLGVALNQSFETLPEALAAVQHLPRWKIAEAADTDLEAQYKVDFRFRLDISQLPRPFQIGALGQADWDVSASASQRLASESTR
jgi:hypothetical protein